MSRVVTLTLNPAIDATIVLDGLHPGHVHRARSVAYHAGGKGVNVAGCLADWGTNVIATGLLGAGNATPFEALFEAKRITDRFIRIPGETRTNIKLSHDGDTTDINLPGLIIQPDEATRIFDRVVELGQDGALVLLAGSVPDGIDADIYARLTAALRARGARVVLDTSGVPLEKALGAADLPFCIKPNRSELEAFAGRPLTSDAALIDAARQLVARGVELVVISLGADGAFFVSAQAVLRASLPVLQVVSTVGAGDAMVAGILAALGRDAGLAETARLATAFASAKLQQPGPNLPPRAVVEALCADVLIQHEQQP